MTAISEDDIWAALAELDVPNTDKNILEKNMVNNLILKDRNVSFVIEDEGVKVAAFRERVKRAEKEYY